MTLYEKRGRRYVPVADTEAINGLHNGSWLVVVENGRTSIRRAVEDAEALKKLAANVRWLEEWLTREIMQSSAAKYGRGEQLSRKEKMAYAAYAKIAGKNAVMWMTRPSAADIAKKVCRKLMEQKL